MEREREVGLRKLLRIVLVMGAILSAFLVLSVSAGSRFELQMGQVEEMPEDWYYIENGTWVDVTLPARITVEPGAELVLYHDIPNRRYAGLTLTTKGARYRLKVSIGDQMLYEYRDEAFPRNSQMADKLNCDAVLPLDVARKTVALTYENGKDGVYQIPMVYVGSSSAVFWYHCMEDAAAILIVFAMAVLSILAVVVSIYMGYERMVDWRVLDLVGFLVLCGTWCITDSSIVQRLTGMSPVTNVVSFYAFMLMSVPMLYFVRNTGNMRKHVVIDLVIDALCLNAMLQGVWNVCFGTEFIDMLFVTHLLLVVGILLTIAAIWNEYRATQDQELFIILRAFAMVATGGIVALILYWALEITYYELIYEFGVLIFMIYLMGRVVRNMAANIRFRAEAEIYDRLAREDSLTGVGNWRAFEEYLEEIEEHSDTYENAVLMFLDISRLRDINDQFGHSAGDEMIIAASRCIERAFAGVGRCFRTDGEEFCVIILNPKGTKEEWDEALNRELRWYNQESRRRLEFIRGLSYLREDGRLKTISDWKYEADQQLQVNKGWRRVEREAE
ncbi:MAG: GGDEF domain-containing protein [Eubacteriales bacterium]|nr:GGDEF domain-containing protein [Eubacteriales bacterium]